MPFIITKPLETQKQEFIAEINTLASDKILALYPDYKQRNMTARYIELVTLSELETTEALSIKDAWDWIKNIRSESNTTNLAITSATNISDIKQLIETFITLLATV